MWPACARVVGRREKQKINALREDIKVYASKLMKICSDYSTVL